MDSACPKIHRQTDFPEDYCNPRRLGLTTRGLCIWLALQTLSMPVLFLCADIATVTVTVPSTTSLSVSWMESTSTPPQHLSTDTFTVTLTPECRNGQITPTAPDPRTVAYNAGPVVFTNLSMLCVCVCVCVL